MHQHGLAEGRAAARASLQIDRRFHVDERQGHEFGKSARLGLQQAQPQQMPRPVNVTVDVTIHDRGRRLETGTMGGTHHLKPPLGSDLVGTEQRAHFIVEDFRGGARQGA
jgi:hypothetical protein